MFGWITGGRIRELEGKLEDKMYDYARLMRNCDAKHHEIVTLQELLESKNRLIGKQDVMIAQLLKSKRLRDPVTGRFIKRGG